MPLSFTDFWAVYPRRKGANPRAPAEAKFNRAIKEGADPSHLIASARRYAEESKEQNLINTPYICSAMVWLNQKRWLDYRPEDETERQQKNEDYMRSKGWEWTGNRWEKHP